MIKEAKIDIKDIFVSKITDQYIEYIQNMDELDLEKASDFVAMAATLLEIKSNDLLPPIDIMEEEQTYYEDEKHEIQRQLEMYALFKDISSSLQLIETRFRFYREPVFDENDCRLVLSGTTFSQLIDAYAAVIHKMEINEHLTEPKNIEKDKYTVAEKVMYLACLIKNVKSIKFFDLFSDDNSKSAVLNTFLALLELLKRQYLSVSQDSTFGDMIITLKEDAESISLEDFDETPEADN